MNGPLNEPGPSPDFSGISFPSVEEMSSHTRPILSTPSDLWTSVSRPVSPEVQDSPSVQIFQGVFFMSQRFVVVEYVPDDVENASSLHEHQCNICMDKPKDLTLLPCKHSLCRECWNNIT